MEDKIYCGSKYCHFCKRVHNILNIEDETVIREFSANFYLCNNYNGCGEYYTENNRFCVLVRYSEFMKNPDKYINMAYDKLKKQICNKVHWRDLR